MLKIGEFSKLCRATIKTLRHYDEIGLLQPDFINEENGYRFYKPEKLQKMAEISEFKEMGLTLEEIMNFFENEYESEELIKLLVKKKSESVKNIELEENKLKSISNYLQNLKELNMKQSIEIKTLPEVYVASMRLTIDKYDDLHTVAPAMGKKMKKHGAECREPFYCFNIYHDGEYRERDIDVEICEAVKKPCKDGDGVIYKKLPEVKKAACLYHVGEYSKLGKSYAKLFKWLEENGYRSSDHPRESYIDGCWNKTDPSEWLTEIQVPIAKCA
ncbi:MAG: GyrI-like domain-containing protein [Fibrobacteres bacterium]|nr:GyrI-like domain-containing protein [Fibrobacterota bacterium]